MLDSELSYLFLIKGALSDLQEVETYLNQDKIEEANSKGPVSLLYTVLYVSQVVELLEKDRLEDLKISNAENLGRKIYDLTYIYASSCEEYGITKGVLLHNYCHFGLQATEDLINTVRKQRYSLL